MRSAYRMWGPEGRKKPVCEKTLTQRGGKKETKGFNFSMFSIILKNVEKVKQDGFALKK